MGYKDFPGPVRGARVSFAGLVRAEWAKLRSLASTYVLIIVAVAINVLVTLVILLSARSALGRPPDGLDAPVVRSLAAYVNEGCVQMGQVILMALAVLTITNEYVSGTINVTLLTAPRRSPVVLAKVVVLAVVGILAMAVSVLVGYVIGLVVLHGTSVPTIITGAEAVHLLVGAVAVVVAVMIIAFSIGAITTSTAPSVVIATVLIFVPVEAATMVPAGGTLARLLALTPGVAGAEAMATPPNAGAPFGPLVSVAILVAWVVGLLGLAVMVTKRRNL